MAAKRAAIYGGVTCQSKRAPLLLCQVTPENKGRKKNFVDISCALREIARMNPSATTVEIYEKGGGDVDRSARYSVSQEVRDAGIETPEFRLFRRIVRTYT